METAPTGNHPREAAVPTDPARTDRPNPSGVLPAAIAGHARWLRAVVYARTRDPDAVDDVMQHVATEATRGFDKLRDPARVGPWLYRIAVIASLQHRRRWGRRRKLIERYASQTQPTEQDQRQPDPLDWLLAEEQRELVRQALAELPPRDAEALLLKHTQDWTYQQIADHLGVSRTAIEGRLHRARHRLRKRLAPQVEPNEHAKPQGHEQRLRINRGQRPA